MLVGLKRKLLKDSIRFFIDTTGCTEDSFVLRVQKNMRKDEMQLGYVDWLAVEIFKWLQTKGITLADCLEFKGLLNLLKVEKKGVYIPSIWKEEICENLDRYKVKDMLYVDLSSEDSEFKYSSNDITGLISFKNFLDCIDMDEYNAFFLNSLPSELKNAILKDSPIFFNVNPFIAEKPKSSVLISAMEMHNFKGKLCNSLAYMYLFRFAMLVEEYNLTNLTVGMYMPTDLFISSKYDTFFNYVFDKLQFEYGMLFNPKLIGVQIREQYLSYIILKSKKVNEKLNAPLFELKVQHTEDAILTENKVLLRRDVQTLHNWCSMSKLQLAGEPMRKVPMLINAQVYGKTMLDRGEEVQGYILSSVNLLRMKKRIGVVNLPTSECIEITGTNFWKCVASVVARTCIEKDTGMLCNKLTAPEMRMDGYSNWLADSLILFLFGQKNAMISYRRDDLILGNKLFPLSIKDIDRFVVDPRLRKDLEENGIDNKFILDRLQEVNGLLSREALDLFGFCKTKIRLSLQGTLRKDIGYVSDLLACDASFMQVKSIKKIYTLEDENTYIYYVDKLQDKLLKGVYSFGFLSST